MDRKISTLIVACACMASFAAGLGASQRHPFDRDREMQFEHFMQDASALERKLLACPSDAWNTSQCSPKLGAIDWPLKDRVWMEGAKLFRE